MCCTGFSTFSWTVVWYTKWVCKFSTVWVLCKWRNEVWRLTGAYMDQRLVCHYMTCEIFEKGTIIFYILFLQLHYRVRFIHPMFRRCVRCTDEQSFFSSLEPVPPPPSWFWTCGVPPSLVSCRVEQRGSASCCTWKMLVPGTNYILLRWIRWGAENF